MSRKTAVAGWLSALLLACGGAGSHGPAAGPATNSVEAGAESPDGVRTPTRAVEVEIHAWPAADAHLAQPHRVATFDRIVSGVVRWQGRTFVALPRWTRHDHPALVEIGADGSVRAWPPEPAPGPALVSVNGFTADRDGRLWVLDNARVDLGPPEPGAPALVVYDLASGALVHRHALADELFAPSTFLNDLAVDLDHARVYITDTGLGGEARLLVYDILGDRMDAHLAGHPALMADPSISMHVGGEPASVTREGATLPWRVGANPIALLPDASTLLVGAMTSRQLFALPTVALRARDRDPDALASRVVSFAERASADGMAALPDGRLALTDLEASGVRLLAPDGRFLALLSHEAMVFPVAVTAEPLADGRVRLWITSSELHRLPMLHAGEDRREGRYHLWAVDVDAWPAQTPDEVDAVEPEPAAERGR